VIYAEYLCFKGQENARIQRAKDDAARAKWEKEEEDKRIKRKKIEDDSERIYVSANGFCFFAS
jgi:hypothetical protein